MTAVASPLVTVSAPRNAEGAQSRMMRCSNFHPNQPLSRGEFLWRSVRGRLWVGALLGGVGWLWSVGVWAQGGADAGCPARAPVYPRWMQVLAPVQRVPVITVEEQEELLAMQQVLALQWAGSAMEMQECPGFPGSLTAPLEAVPGSAEDD